MKRAPLALLALLALSSCTTQTGDPHVDAGVPSPIGNGARLRDVANPDLPTHPANNAVVNVTGAAVLAVDMFDETANGKSRGTVYVQDVGSQEPYSGLSLYSPTYIPGDLRLAPGDVLDLVGAYQENKNIGTAVFTVPQVLPQIAKPVATFRYEYRAPDPVVIDAKDLDDYVATGRRWLNMLVTVKDVTLATGIAFDSKGQRATGFLTAANVSKVTNELTQLDALPAGTKLKSVTGIVTYFFELHIAPRSKADIVQ
jgi:hypothetical protein